MEKVICSVCQKPKATLDCGLCQCSICKYCAQILEEDAFSFSAQIPQDLSHQVYCGPCFDGQIASEIEKYNQIMEKAKDIQVFFTTQGKETRLIKRTEDPIQVLHCKDRDETILRLAFLAAQAGFNGIIDVNIVSEKIKNGHYQTSQWSGTAVPAHVKPEKLVRDKSIWHNPN